MAKLDMKTVWKYLALGAGAVAVPALIGKVGALSGMLAKIPLWGQDLAGIATAGGIVLAAVGVWAVDQLILKR